MKKDMKEAHLKKVLKENGLLQPSDQFSERLTRLAVVRYQPKPTEEYPMATWLGKLIMGILVAANLLLLLFLLKPSVVVYSFVAFGIGLGCIIRLLQQNQRSQNMSS